LQWQLFSVAQQGKAQAQQTSEEQQAKIAEIQRRITAQSAYADYVHLLTHWHEQARDIARLAATEKEHTDKLDRKSTRLNSSPCPYTTHFRSCCSGNCSALLNKAKRKRSKLLKSSKPKSLKSSAALQHKVHTRIMAICSRIGTSRRVI